MFDLRMIDVAISLALLYMMLAGLVSGLQEWISNALNLRGKHLCDGIASLLHAEVPRSLQGDEGGPVQRIYQHPTIQALCENTKRLPSYIPAATFVLVLADELVSSHRRHKELPPCEDPKQHLLGLADAINDLQDGPLKRSLSVLVAQAQGDAAALRQAIEQHYNQVMERVSGWYKRRTQRLAFVSALLLAVTLNVDTLAIITHLNAHPAKAAALAAQAQAQLDVLPVEPSASQVVASVASLRQQVANIQDTGLPLGWPGLSQSDPVQLWHQLVFDFSGPAVLHSLLKLLGWLITGLAAAMGAPFWFDMLSRLVSLRSSVRPQVSKPAN